MSNPTWPVYTFQVNLPVLQRYSWAQPNRSSLDGNETSSEVANQPMTHTTWLTNLFPGCNFIAEGNGFTFTAYGMQAVYLRSVYCSNPPNPLADALILLTPGASTPQTGLVPSPSPNPMQQGIVRNPTQQGKPTIR